MEAHETETAILHAEARNQVVETVELSEDEDDVEVETADLTLTASVFAEPRLTADDFDAFALEPHHIPQPVAKGEVHSLLSVDF